MRCVAIYKVRRKKTLADHRLVTKCRKKKPEAGFFYGATQTLPVFNFRAVPICAIKTKTTVSIPCELREICEKAEILARRDPPKIVGSDRGFFFCGARHFRVFFTAHPVYAGVSRSISLAKRT